MATFIEKQKIADVIAKTIVANGSDAAYCATNPSQLVLGRFEDVGGYAGLFNELAHADARGGCYCAVFHNNTLVCGSERDIVLLDVSAGTLNQCGALQAHNDAVRVVAAHGDWLASGGWHHAVRLWSMTALEELYCMTDHAPYYGVNVVCFSHNGRWLASGSDDKRVIVYDATRDFAQRTTLTLSRPVHAVCFSPDDSMLAVGAIFGCSAIYSVDAFEPLRALAGNHAVRSVAWLGNDADSLVGGTDDGGLVVWNTSTGNVTSQEKVHDAHIYSLSFTSSFRTLLTGCGDGTARVYDVYNNVHSHATAALYGASLHVFRTLRRTDVGALAMQLIAESLAGSLEPLSEHERTRIFTASRVIIAVRGQRLTTLEALDNFHARMHWLRTSTPTYSADELAPLGKSFQ